MDPSGHNCGTTQSRYNSDEEQHPKANAAGGIRLLQRKEIVRVVHLLDFIRMQMADGIDQMVTLHQMQKLE